MPFNRPIKSIIFIFFEPVDRKKFVGGETFFSTEVRFFSTPAKNRFRMKSGSRRFESRNVDRASRWSYL